MDATLKFRPLYQQVRNELLQRLIDGRWPPGMLLPSEQQLAAELGVSQGTVRKSLDVLAAENLLIRRQGRGTFVAVPEEGRLLFQFFRLASDDGDRVAPTSVVDSLLRVRADPAARKLFQLPSNASVWEIKRVRSLGGRPVIFEQIIVPANRFAELDQFDPLPNNVYGLYASHFGITIGRTVEKLKAVAASAVDAEKLGCAAGTPLLLIDRTAFGLDGLPAELRSSRCLTDDFHYLSDLR